MDAKAGLAGVVERLARRPEAPSEVLYTVEGADGSVQATVELFFLGPEVCFTGETCEDAEAAEQSAAAAALAEFAQLGQLAAKHLGAPARPGKRSAVEAFEDGEGAEATEQPRRGGPGPVGRVLPVGQLRMPDVSFSPGLWPDGSFSLGLVAGAGNGSFSPVGRGAPLVRPSPLFQKRGSGLPAGVPAGVNAKGRLNELASKLLGRPLTKEDQVYTIAPGRSGFVASVALPTLGGKSFAGAACSKRKEAEHSAAAVALAALQRNGVSAAPGALAALPMVPQKRPLPKVPSSASLDSTFTEWQAARLEPPEEGEAVDSLSLDFWYGQTCILCLVVCSKCGWATHAAGQKHQRRFEAGRLRKRPEVPRPPTEPSADLLPAELFVQTSGWALPDAPPVLLVGEMDYSFSLAVARLRPAGGPLVATSYLEKHDPFEPEVYPSDDGERAVYRRRTLPSMKGALQANLAALEELGADVRHGVDATRLGETLRSQGVEGGFRYVVFPFPRASLQRACDPRNSQLLRGFFLSVSQEAWLLEGGIIQLVMLGTQYEEWDVACMAMEAGFTLKSRAQLPPDFYQSREMSGKPWTPQGAELLCFHAEE